ncbi:MAG: phage holin family protein [Pseudolysinimonas sp.]
MRENEDMGRLILRLLINALALWLTTIVLAPHVAIAPFAPGTMVEFVITLLITALIFGLVNGIIGGIIRVVAFPLYVLTLGLISLVVNGLLFLLVAWISSLLGFGLSVDGFWWGVLGAVVVAVISWLIGILLRPFTGSKKKR